MMQSTRARLDGATWHVWQNLIAITIGGALGTLSRYGLSTLATHLTDRSIWGTVAVNMIGCLCFGFVAELTETRAHIPPHIKLMLLVGFMGSFTTFSTFASDTTRLMQDGRMVHALGNVLSQNIAGVLCVFLGISLAKLMESAGGAIQS